MGKDGGKRSEERKLKKERKEREKEEKLRSRQRASSDSGNSVGPLDLVTVMNASGRLRSDSASVPPLSASGGLLNGEGGGVAEALDATKSPSSFLLDQMTTMLALMNGHHEHEMARLSVDGLLDTLKKIEDNDPGVTSFDGQDYFHCFTTELYERLFLALEKNRSLATLKLTHLNLEDGHLEFLAESLQINTSITLLDLSWNHFTNEGVFRLLEALEGSLGNKSLQDIYLLGNSEEIHPKITREIQKYLRSNKKTKRTSRSGATILLHPPSSGAASALSHLSSTLSPLSPLSQAPYSPHTATSSASLSSSGGALGVAGAGAGAGAGGGGKRSSLPAGEKEKERMRRLEDELNLMSREMKESEKEKKALKDLNELLKQKITELSNAPPASPSTSGHSFPSFPVAVHPSGLNDSKAARRLSKELEKEEKEREKEREKEERAVRKAEKTALRRAKRSSASQTGGPSGAAPVPGGAPHAGAATKSPRGVKNFFAAGSSDASVLTQKRGRDRAHSLTLIEDPTPSPGLPAGAATASFGPVVSSRDPPSPDKSLGASHLYGMASLSALGNLISGGGSASPSRRGGAAAAVIEAQNKGTVGVQNNASAPIGGGGGGGGGGGVVTGGVGGKKVVIGRCIKQVSIDEVNSAAVANGEVKPSEHDDQKTKATKNKKKEDDKKATKIAKKNENENVSESDGGGVEEDVYCSEYECLVNGWGCRMRELRIPISLLSNTIHSISSPPASPTTAKSLEARRAVRLTKRGLDTSVNSLDELEKEIIRLEQLPAHESLVRFLGHDRCGPHYDTLRVYLQRHETSLGEFLKARRKRRELLSEWQVIQISNQIHAALHFLHAHSILHRDLRLENIFVWGDGPDGMVAVGGFDTMDAVAAGAYDPKLGVHLNLGFRAPHYLAPELLSAAPSTPLVFTTQADVWALGMVLYSLLTLRVPFEGMSHAEVREAILAGQRPELKSRDQLEADTRAGITHPAIPSPSSSTPASPSPSSPSPSSSSSSSPAKKGSKKGGGKAKESAKSEAEQEAKEEGQKEKIKGAVAEEEEEEEEKEERRKEKMKALMRYAKLQDLVRNMTAQDPARRPTPDKVKLYLFLCESM